MNGYRFTVERQKLCAWLEEEKARAAVLPPADRANTMLDLERQFRVRLDGLYADARGEFEPHGQVQ